MIELQKYFSEIAASTSESQIDNLLLDALHETSFVAFLFRIEKDFFTYVGSVDPSSIAEDKLLDGLRIPIGQALTAFATRKFLLSDNLEQKSDFNDLLPLFINRGCKSVAVLPLNVNEKIDRLLIVGSRDVEPIGQTDILPIQEIINSSEKVLNKLAQESSTEKQTQYLELVKNITDLISKETNLSRLLPYLHSQLQLMYGRERDFSIVIHEKSADVIQFLYVYENGKIQNPRQIKFGEGLLSHIIQNKRTLFWQRQGANIVQRMGITAREVLPKSYIGVPLSCNNVAIGAMVLADSKEEDAFQDTDVNYLSSVGSILASVLSALQANREKDEQTEKSEFNNLLINHLFDHSPFNIAVKDTQGKYLQLNKKQSQLLKLSDAQSAIGQSDMNLMSETEGIQNYKDDLDVISSGFAKLNSTTTRKLPNGSLIDLTQNKIPIRTEEGKALGLLEISWDDTELKNSRQISEKREVYLKLAADVISVSSGGTNFYDQLYETMELIQSRMGLIYSGLFLLSKQEESLSFIAGSGEAGKKHKGDGLILKLQGKSVISQVINDGNYRIITDTGRDQNYLQDDLLPETKSELLVPLKFGNEVLGMMDYKSSEVNHFSTEELPVLQLIADQIALLVSNATQAERTKEYLARQRSMYLITSLATTAPSIDEVYSNVVEGLSNTLPASQISIFTPSSKGDMVMKTSRGYDKKRTTDVSVPIGEGVIGQVAREKRSIVIDDVSAVENYVPIDPKTQSELAIPILFRDDFFGVLNIESPIARAFNENDVEILSTLANSLGSIISSVRLVGQIREQVDRQQQLYSITDKIRRSVDIESILNTAAEELGKALNARHMEIEITGSDKAAAVEPLSPQDMTSTDGGNQQ